ncbi:hypothetical protein BDB00DRAFT_878739 [Zychaea mexicana]|uniref:uncharacterized protein n=1 Tax=Zychaea mexicana TaxID=64656 RepID=UPI0022FDD476|nr:uncharacterized protein BDB00DRAFT_878739 [Zychaea mexicana]KAI9484539.1 hypothetical protein BDB00DRAFT_878739 [Zychaea mexicana]
MDKVLELIPSRHNLRNVANSLEDYSLDAYVQLDDDMLALSDSQLVINIRDRSSCISFTIASVHGNFLMQRLHQRHGGMVDRVNGYFYLNIEHSYGHRAAPAVENNAVP